MSGMGGGRKFLLQKPPGDLYSVDVHDLTTLNISDLAEVYDYE